jgi:hypothetical protein
VIEHDSRRVLDWWLDLLGYLIQRVTISQFIVTHICVPTVMSSLSLLGSGFNGEPSPSCGLLNGPRLQLSACNSNSSQRLYFSSSLTDWGSWLDLYITSLQELRRKHHYYDAVKLLLSDGMTYSIIACATIGRDCAEYIIILLLYTGLCLARVGCCDYTIFALSEYASVFTMTSCGTNTCDGEDLRVRAWTMVWMCQTYQFPWEDM